MNNPSRLLRLEPLESRRAPASLADPKSLVYKDPDGDIVTVSMSRPLPAGTDANTIFHFDTGTVDGTTSAGQQLQTIDLTGLPNGLSVGVAVTTKNGDGFADVGWVNGTGRDLGNIGIAGDLGRITAGDTKASAPAVGILAVGSQGAKGTTTQSAGGTLDSVVSGKLTALAVAGDFVDANLQVSAKIGRIVIGGSLRGGTADDTGVIDAESDIGPVTIVRDMAGGLGSGARISSNSGRIASLKVGRILGDGPGSASIQADAIGALSVIGYQIPGGALIPGDVIGGAGDYSANIQSFRMGPVIVAGDWRGGSGVGSASLKVIGGMGSPEIPEGRIASIKIGGDLTGDARDSGQLWGENQTGAVSVGKSIKGGAGLGSGSIQSTYIKSVKVGGDLQGGGGKYSGIVMSGLVFEAAFGRPDYILAWGTIKTVAIGGSIIGGAGRRSGALIGGQGLGSVTVTGDVRGDTGPQSGTIQAVGVTDYVFDASAGGKISSVTIGGSLKGADGNISGAVISNQDIGTVKITGSMLGGTDYGSGSVTANNNIKTVTVLGDIHGGIGYLSAAISAEGKIGGVTVLGSVLGGAGTLSASVVASQSIGLVNVMVDWTGASILAGVDPGTDNLVGTSDDKAFAAGAIKSITIGGKAEGTAASSDAFAFEATRIGALKIGGVATVLQPGSGNDTTAIPLGTQGDFVAIELAVPIT